MSNTNTGDLNTGNLNTGDWNTGNRNTGDWNTGDWNTGHWNTGHRNTGDRNTGHWNTGHRNTGDRNTGHWNTASNHVGCFNTHDAEKALYFNKECLIEEWEKADKPSFLYAPSPTTWINKGDMTSEEKRENPLFETAGGYLRKNNMKDEWRNAWDSASDEDKDLLFKLPNFDADVFMEITGIDVRKQEVEEMTLEQVCRELGRTVKIVK